MITPAYAPTATERVLPRLALDFTTGTLDPRVTVARALNTATRVNSSGYIETVNADLPRFDYTPVTLAPKGLLIEEARTNAASYSEDFSNAAWTKGGLLAFGSGSTVNATAAPDNAVTADLITEDTSTGSHRVYRQFTLAANTACSFSIFAKRASGTRNIFIIMQFGVDLLYCRVNLGTGAIIQQGTGGTASGQIVSVQPYGNSFYRISMSGIVSTTGTNPFCQVYLNNSDAAGGSTAPSYTGDGTSGLYIWGAQFETGAFPTSYIPTTTTSLTRNADVVSMTGTNFSSWYNASEGTFVASASTNATFGHMYSIDDNTANNRLYQSFGTASTSVAVAAGSTTFNQTVGTLTLGSTVKTSFAYKANDCVSAVNGSAGATDTTVTIPAVNQMRIGRNIGGVSLNGHMRSIYFYNQRLLNAENAAFTN